MVQDCKDRFTVGVFALVFDDKGRLLMCRRRDNRQWDLPGGAKNKGESCLKAVVRETFEETGFEIHVLDLVALYDKTDVDDIVLFFKCEIIGGEKKLMMKQTEFAFLIQISYHCKLLVGNVS